MKKLLAGLVVGGLLIASLAIADPGVHVEYRQGVPNVRLEGDFPGARYTILRSDFQTGPFDAVSDANTLCTGVCALDDYEAEAGDTYWYRFDLELANGSFQTFGPYPVTISAEARPVRADIFPNPGRGPASVQLFLSGRPNAAPVDAEVAIYDLQGRLQVMLLRGPVARGASKIEWNGRAASGRPLDAGVYFLRFSSPLGSNVSRLIRLN